MIWFSLVIVVLVICFGGVLLVGAPYLPTLKRQIDIALELYSLKSGDTLIELGSGDGKVVIAAAKRGIKVIGYELNPILVVVSRIRTWRYRANVKIVWANFWSVELPESEVIFTFLLSKYMASLDQKISQSNNKPARLISFAFEVPGKKPTVSKKGIYVYEYN